MKTTANFDTARPHRISLGASKPRNPLWPPATSGWPARTAGPAAHSASARPWRCAANCSTNDAPRPETTAPGVPQRGPRLGRPP